MTTIKIERVVDLKDEESTRKFMKRAGSKATRARHTNFRVITEPMTDDLWDLIRFWASENGLLAN